MTKNRKIILFVLTLFLSNFSAKSEEKLTLSQEHKLEIYNTIANKIKEIEDIFIIADSTQLLIDYIEQDINEIKFEMSDSIEQIIILKDDYNDKQEICLTNDVMRFNSNYHKKVLLKSLEYLFERKDYLAYKRVYSNFPLIFMSKVYKHKNYFYVLTQHSTGMSTVSGVIYLFELINNSMVYIDQIWHIYYR